MRYTQDSGVRRKGDGDEYKVVVSVYLKPEERDRWGAGEAWLALVVREPGGMLRCDFDTARTITGSPTAR